MNSDNDPRAIDWAEKQVARLDEKMTGLIEQFSDEIETLTGRINELQNAIASKVRHELSAGFRDLEPEPEFSTPIGGTGTDNLLWKAQRRVGDIEDRTHLRGTGRPARDSGIFALSEMSEDRRLGTQFGGVVPEEKTSLELAEERIRAKIQEMGWHPNSPAALGFINAVRGTEPIGDQPQG